MTFRKMLRGAGLDGPVSAQEAVMLKTEVLAPMKEESVLKLISSVSQSEDGVVGKP